MFHFDDYNVIVNYPTVHSWEALLERAGLRRAAAAEGQLHAQLDLFGRSAFSLLNIALHAMNAALLFLDRRSAYSETVGPH